MKSTNVPWVQYKIFEGIKICCVFSVIAACMQFLRDYARSCGCYGNNDRLKVVFSLISNFWAFFLNESITSPCNKCQFSIIAETVYSLGIQSIGFENVQNWYPLGTVTPLKTTSSEKFDCVGHIQKQMGKYLLKL